MKLNLLMAAALVLSTTTSMAELQEMTQDEMSDASVGVSESLWKLSMMNIASVNGELDEKTRKELVSKYGIENVNELEKNIATNLAEMMLNSTLRNENILVDHAQRLQLASLPMQLQLLDLVRNSQKHDQAQVAMFQEMIKSIGNNSMSRQNQVSIALNVAGNFILNSVKSDGTVTQNRLVFKDGEGYNASIEKGLKLNNAQMEQFSIFKQIFGNVQIIGLDLGATTVTVEFTKQKR